VVGVLDGDSVQARVEGAVAEIRMLGIDAPERGECWADQARRAAASLLKQGPVLIESHGRDQYGRTLGYLWAGGALVNARLLEEGHAIAVTGDHPRMEEFRAIEEEAIAARRGWWAPDACGPAPVAGVRIGEVDGNPPGPDDDPEDGESVLIVNNGTATADLGGWTIRDESSVHRFVFPEGFSLAPGGRVRVFSVCGVHPLCFGTVPVWSNHGDTALLLDAAGNVADRVRFSG
jgi:hypothetical protein